MTRHTPILPADPKHMAKSIVRAHPLFFCAQLLVALVEEMDCELQNGWVDPDGNIAEGSLESAAAFSGVEGFRDFIKTLRYSDESFITDVEEHSPSFAQLGLTKTRNF